MGHAQTSRYSCHAPAQYCATQQARQPGQFWTSLNRVKHSYFSDVAKQHLLWLINSKFEMAQCRVRSGRPAKRSIFTMAEGSQPRVVLRAFDRGPRSEPRAEKHSKFRMGMNIADALLSSQRANTKKARKSTPYSFVSL